MVRAGDWAWELLLDAAALKNIIHTFPRRSLLGNTDTVRVIGFFRTDEQERAQHRGRAAPVRLIAGWIELDVSRNGVWNTVEPTGCPECGDQAWVRAVGREVERMLCELLPM